ncbi:MAG: D-2-hydroxyacid dehydrogenase, partial [Acidobacteria bacterium]|nr:D-2-hydroxyacid dehydrogenase [Acidobacteriota bacterium]
MAGWCSPPGRGWGWNESANRQISKSQISKSQIGHRQSKIANRKSAMGDMLNVVVAFDLAEEHLQTLAAVSPEIVLRRGFRNFDPARWQETHPGPTAFPPADLEALLPQAEVVFSFRPPADLLRQAPRLRWLQLASAGADWVTNDPAMMASAVLITTCSGIHAIPIAEYVVGSMLSFAHRFCWAVRHQAQHRWERYLNRELFEQTLGIVGYGHIGREIGRLGRALGMRVIATRRSATAGEQADGVELFSPERLSDLLAQSDYVVIAVPLTHATEHLIGEQELRAMRPTAYFVNIARGKVVD